MSATNDSNCNGTCGSPKPAGKQKPSNKTSKLLAGILVLQALTLVTLWKGGDGASNAYGDLPDGGVADRRQMIDELRNLNGKMEKLVSLMESGNLQVKVVKTDDNKAAR